MKKIAISFLAISLFVCGLHAQDVKFGIRGGLNLPNREAKKNGFQLRSPLFHYYEI